MSKHKFSMKKKNRKTEKTQRNISPFSKKKKNKKWKHMRNTHPSKKCKRSFFSKKRKQLIVFKHVFFF